MTIKELQEKRLTLAAEIRKQADAFSANNKAWKDDAERSAWEKVNADYDANQKELDAAVAAERTAKSVEERQALLAEHDERSKNHGQTVPGLEDTRGRKPVGGDDGSQITEETRALALAGWCRGQMGHRLNESHLAAMQRVGMQPWQRELTFDFAPTHQFRALQRRFRSAHPSRAVDHCLEERTMSAQDGTSGGFTVGSTLLRTLEVNMLAFGGMRQVAETIVTNTGERMTWPTADDTSNTGQMLGESASVGSSVDPSFGGVIWDAYKFSSKAVLVPYELLEDSFVDLPRVLGEMLGERIGRITNTKYTTGRGGSEPKGIVTGASLGVTAASQTAIAADELIGLVHSVDQAYRNGAGFMCHDSVLLHIRKLKDGNGRYLMEFGLTQNMPDTILGYGVTNNQDMASSVATGEKTVLFGQLSSYKIRRVRQVRMYRLEERYRDNDQDGFIALVREDGNLLTAGTARVKYLVQA